MTEAAEEVKVAVPMELGASGGRSPHLARLCAVFFRKGGRTRNEMKDSCLDLGPRTNWAGGRRILLSSILLLSSLTGL